MKILIAGATGMLAKPVIEHFEKNGHELRLFSRSIKSTDYNGKFEVINGDVFNENDLKRAIEGCDAIHITLSKIDEALAVKAIIKAAGGFNIKLISYVSGSTVSKENSWFPMISNKLSAEETIINSGIPYIIFRPTWFFESLNMMIRNGKAMMIGKQPKPFSWVSGDDFGRMTTTAYLKDEAKYKIFYIHGPEKHLMIDLLKQYAKHLKLKNQKVKPASIGMLKFIAFITGNKMLKMAASLFSYFEKVDELGDVTETNNLLGAPTLTFNQWVNMQ